MQASDQFHCSFVTLNSYIKSPQKFVLCYLSVACSQFLALLHCSVFKVQVSNLLQGQIETFRSRKTLQSDLILVEIIGIEPMTPCLQSRCSPSWAIPPYEVWLVVGPSGLEPPTSRLSVVRSSQLSYGPISLRGVPSKLNIVGNFQLL